MPIIENAAINGDIIRKVHGQHTGRRPGVFQIGVGRVLAIREPHRREMHPPVICGVHIRFKRKG